MSGADPFANFERDGFALVRHPDIAAAKDALRDALMDTAQFIARRVLTEEALASLPADQGFDAFLDAVHAAETGNAVTRALYEVFPSLPSIISMLDAPFVLDLVRRAGVARPVAGTLPLIRLDRPNDTKFSTPAHQDSWYSMLSPNAVTLWTPLCHMDADMGLLGVVPGSHRKGVCGFKPYEAGHEWFETAEPVGENDLTPVAVGHDEILIFNQSLIHKSGFNASQRVRISVQLRYNDLATAQSLTRTYTPSLSAWVLDQQKARLDDLH
ncbi:phytanoyl-CoA dioxygenase family protein [Hyphobacterium sp. HN65]|uniref:Phytanoyl-CoA dioxygenase family protein n=1 Tax=Hyphobacterium lacteum TaxID=3116575 RepID=A0ABU7LRD7_9PROT|nr:phytanoyl-CoA dioxygenase family protein [Hyphobacterium sp. HN65]MEE2526201.1 phytanoyl-CoA dioxygenase family protein [Hyphobacterium sp. HN65]